MKDTVNIDSKNWKTKITERSKGRMKIGFKLSKEEAEAFKNWTSAVRPHDVDDNAFYKTIFFNGVEFLNMQLRNIAEEQLNAQREAEKAATESERPTTGESDNEEKKD